MSHPDFSSALTDARRYLLQAEHLAARGNFGKAAILTTQARDEIEAMRVSLILLCDMEIKR